MCPPAARPGPPSPWAGGDYDQAQRILGGCFTLQVGISLVLTAVLLIWNRPLLLAFGASGNTIGYAVQYMQIYALGTCLWS